MLLNLKAADGLDLSKSEAIDAAAAALGNARTESGVYVALASLFYCIGATDKVTAPNTPRDLGVPFKAFRAAHAKKLKDSSAINYLSTFKAFYEVARHPKYDGAGIAEFGLSKLKGSFSERGKVLRAILTAHPETAPTDEQMEMLRPVKVNDTIADVADDIVDTAEDMLETFAAIISADPKLDMLVAELLEISHALKRAVPRVIAETVDHKARSAEKRAAYKASLKAAK